LRRKSLWFVLLLVFVLLVVGVRNLSGVIASFVDEISVDLRIFNWDGVAGISNALMVMLNLILVLGIFLSYFNFRENTKSRVFEMLDMAYTHIDGVKDDIETIRTRAKGIQEWSIDDDKSIQAAASIIPNKEAQRVSKTFQRLSYLVKAKLIPEKYFIEMWGPLFLEMWLSLEPWIIQKRINNLEPRTYKENAFSRKDFEWFAAQCCRNSALNILPLERIYAGRIAYLKTIK